MTKKIIYLIISTVMIIAVLTGCHQAKETDSSLPDGQNTTAVITTESASETTTAESTTKADEPSTMSETTEKKTTESSTAKASTTKAQSTTTTTKKHTTTTTTTKRVTTTQKKTITQKPSTTHKATTKPTTTKAATTKHKHGAPCGNMGKWYSSKNELKNDYMRVSDSWLAKYDNGEIDWDTYVKNCPCGYECWSCGECGMWTGNYKY